MNARLQVELDRRSAIEVGLTVIRGEHEVLIIAAGDTDRWGQVHVAGPVVEANSPVVEKRGRKLHVRTIGLVRRVPAERDAIGLAIDEHVVRQITIGTQIIPQRIDVDAPGEACRGVGRAAGEQTAP